MGEHPTIDSRDYIVAFELRSTDDCPADFELPRFLADFDTGLFLPRADPDWFGRSAYPPRVLLLKDGALSVISHPSAGEQPCRWALEQICSVESGHMLLKGWLRFTGSGFDCTIRYNTRGLRSVLWFMGQFRDKWLRRTELSGLAAVHFGAGLDVKFANALARELDSGESVLMQVFLPPRPVMSKSWLLPYRRWIAGDLLALTSRRLLWVTDRDRGSYSRYGSIASYAPLHAVLNIGLTSGRGGQILQVDLNSGSAWQIPVALENKRVEENFAAALEIQKKQNQVPL
jgi:hypothetical protein